MSSNCRHRLHTTRHWLSDHGNSFKFGTVRDSIRLSATVLVVEKKEGARISVPLRLRYTRNTAATSPANTRVVVCQRANNLPRAVQHSGFTRLQART
ncbi:hypothetical protein OBBRIDRAFT_413465 [Obba rivulosa]|uniref:Uncharacterized protein n=1 Tax=Obba rivulosa TaxID=1052685 RepID=A0A8E2AJ60_9APHY|nr:hypothetical protein OBBRIDRAFT_413465 [Obba rivulosa]